jgi:hypothetical protein
MPRTINQPQVQFAWRKYLSHGAGTCRMAQVLVAWLRRATHGSAVRHMALVAPPPGPNEAHTFPAVARGKDTCAGCTNSCPPKLAVCFAVRSAEFEPGCFGHDDNGFESEIRWTASHLGQTQKTIARRMHKQLSAQTRGVFCGQVSRV